MAIFGEKFRTIKCNCWSTEERILEMKEDKIDIQVLSPIPVMFCYWARSKDALEVSRFLNDFITNECEKSSRNFIGRIPAQFIKISIFWKEFLAFLII